MSREERDRRFPEIQVYPQPPSAYKIIEPYVEFAADLEARGEMTSVERERERGEGMRSQTTPHKTRKPQGIAPNNRPNTQTRSPRNVKTAPANTEGLVRDSLQIMKKPQPVVSLLFLPPPLISLVRFLLRQIRRHHLKKPLNLLQR